MSTIVFSHVFFSYGTLPVLTNVSFTCGPTDRLIVVVAGVQCGGGDQQGHCRCRTHYVSE